MISVSASCGSRVGTVRRRGTKRTSVSERAGSHVLAGLLGCEVGCARQVSGRCAGRRRGARRRWASRRGCARCRRPACGTTRAGVCQSVQRSVLGSATASCTVKQSSWNQRTRSSAKHTTASQARLASRSTNGNRSAPESFSRRMWSSTWAWARMCTSSVDGVAGLVGVVTPVAERVGREQGVLRAGVQRFAPHDQSGAWRPAGQVDEVGELAHRGAGPFVAVWCAPRAASGRRRPPILAIAA